jgi:pyruvate,water dikinase
MKRSVGAKEHVGSKGLGLIEMIRLGIAVPPGFILPVRFFDPWFEILHNDPAWDNIRYCSLTDLKSVCELLKEQIRSFRFNPQQSRELQQALIAFKLSNPIGLFAVRSSSPDEDLVEASFAGGYHTTLGVREVNLEQAIIQSFASCFDERIVSPCLVFH